MVKNSHLYLSIGIRVGHSKLLSEFFVYSNHLCVSIKSMNMIKKGMSTSRPCLLSETNYGYWKIHMSVFIKSLGMDAWQSVVIGWSLPTRIDDGKIVIKD